MPSTNKKFRMKHPPSPPLKKIEQAREYYVGYDLEISDLLLKIENGEISSNGQIHLCSEGDSCYECGGTNQHIYISWSENESDECFNKRMEEYCIKLQEYNKWRDDNKEQIEFYNKIKKENALLALKKRNETKKHEIIECLAEAKRIKKDLEKQGIDVSDISQSWLENFVN